MSTPANCTKCGERMRVACSKRAAPDVQLQYLVCPACRARRSREVPACHVWRRKR